MAVDSAEAVALGYRTLKIKLGKDPARDIERMKLIRERVVYGVIDSRGSSYSIVVMVTTAVVTGLVGGLKLNDLFDAMVEGASRYVWLFIMFIDEAGAFKALVALLQPLLKSQSKPLFALIASLTGIFGVGGAAVAQSVVIDKMFKDLVVNLNLSSMLWAAIVLVGSQITSFAYPEAPIELEGRKWKCASPARRSSARARATWA